MEEELLRDVCALLRTINESISGTSDATQETLATISTQLEVIISLQKQTNQFLLRLTNKELAALKPLSFPDIHSKISES